MFIICLDEKKGHFWSLLHRPILPLLRLRIWGACEGAGTSAYVWCFICSMKRGLGSNMLSLETQKLTNTIGCRHMRHRHRSAWLGYILYTIIRCPVCRLVTWHSVWDWKSNYMCNVIIFFHIILSFTLLYFISFFILLILYLHSYIYIYFYIVLCFTDANNPGTIL